MLESDSRSFRCFVRSISLMAFLGLGVRSRYIQARTVRGGSSRSSAAFSTPRARMNAGKSMAMRHIPRFAVNVQGVAASEYPRFAEHPQNQAFTLCPMDYKEEIGRRIRRARDDKGWTLAETAKATDDVLTISRIQNYESGYRMPGPAEAVILSKALGVRASYIMAIDDTQLIIAPQEEKLVRNWRTLNERERMEIFRHVESMAMQSRDPVAEQRVETYFPPKSDAARLPKATVHRKVKR